MVIGSGLVAGIQIVFGNPLSKYMAEAIFETDNSHKYLDSSQSARLKALARRK